MRTSILILISFTILLSSYFSEATIINAKKANVRGGPGLNQKVMFVYRTNAPLEILGEDGKWLQVKDFEDEVGWVSRKVVDIEKRGAIVKVANANVRKGPGLKHPVVFLAGYGVAFEVINAENEWFQIKHEDGDIGWIEETLVFSPQNVASSQDGATLSSPNP